MVPEIFTPLVCNGCLGIEIGVEDEDGVWAMVWRAILINSGSKLYFIRQITFPGCK